MKIKRLLYLLMALLMLVAMLAGCGGKNEKKEFVTFEDFKDANLGVLTGNVYEIITEKLFPESKKQKFDTIADLLISVDIGKIDGFLMDYAHYSAVGWEKSGYAAIESKTPEKVEYAYIVSDNERGNTLKREINKHIAEIRENGELKAFEEKWFSGTRPLEHPDWESLTGERGTINIGIADTDMPVCYQDNDELTGFDTEVLYSFAKKYGYALNFSTADFDLMLGGVKSQKFDMAVGGIEITDERRETFNFTDPYYQSPVVMVTKGESDGKSRLSDFSDRRIGIVTGTMTSVLVPKLIPEADYVEFNSVADAKMALEKGKVDAFPTDESIYLAMKWEGSKFDRVLEPIAPSDYGVIFKKGEKLELQKEFNTYLADIKSNGKWQELQDKWFGISEPLDFETYDDLTGENGTLRVGINSSSKPFTYIKNGKYAGYDIEVIIGFCREYGYNIEFEDTLFAGVLTGVAAGNYDMGAAGFTITDERKESVDFSDVYHTEDLVLVVRAQSEKSDDESTTYLANLEGKKIGVMTGSIQAVMMPDMITTAEYMEFNSQSDMIVALNSNKIDAFGCDESLYTSMLWEGQKIDRIDEPLGESNYGIIFPKDKRNKLKAEVNEFIKKVNDDGTLSKMETKWFGDKEPEEFISYDDLTGENGTIRVAVNSSSMPFVYLNNKKFVGFDVEFIVAFAKEYGYKLEFEDTAFASILGGVQSEKYDIGLSGITITDERKESMDFSDVYHVEDLAVIIRKEEGEESLTQFNTASLGVVTGSLYGGYSKEQFPNATIKEFNNFSDVLVALKNGKVEGIMLDKPNFNSVARGDKRLKCITVPAYSVEIGFGFQKNDGGDALQTQMNEFLAKLDSDGTTEKLIDKWYGETEPQENIPLEELSANKKTLNVSIDTTRKPFVYMYEGKPVGFEIEVLYMFCKEYGYNVNISDVSFASGLAGLASEKYDLVCGGLYMTPERKESVNFSNPYMIAEVVMAKYERTGLENFMLSVMESFEKTFVREQRWKLIVEGIYTTIVISVFSVLGGTLLGFALYMLARSKKKWISRLAKAFAKIYSAIIAGTPTLVVLMILFYVVFTSPDMSGVIVAIVGFILTFGSFVYDNLDLTVSGVDKGQLEAAYALGYSRNRTFFRIILPQAMKMFVPSYSGEIINLIKATSVVGYIAVNDLTKMGDIIRGNTYEAFFPLIAVAVIYFAITWIIARLLGILRKKTEPKKRKNKNILKGVVR